MKFCWSTLGVKDMDESIKFYKEVVGLPLNQRFKAGPDMEIAFLGKGETQIELICQGDDKDIHVGEDISWGFEVESLEHIIEFLRQKGIDIYQGPFSPNPASKFLFIKDPNGFKIQFYQHIK